MVVRGQLVQQWAARLFCLLENSVFPFISLKEDQNILRVLQKKVFYFIKGWNSGLTIQKGY